MTKPEPDMAEILASIRAIIGDEPVSPRQTQKQVPPCDAYAFGQFERAAHVLQMLTAGGVKLAKPAELNRLLGMLANTLSRRGPHASRSDYDAASSTLAALEAARLITIEPARRKRALAILGSALSVRC